MHFNDPEQFQLSIRKGIFPYDFCNSWDVLKQRKLPPQEKFYSKLTHSTISDEDYAHACQVWRVFDIKTLSEYAIHYLKLDVLVATDVFEKFRDLCQHIYGWDLDKHFFDKLTFDVVMEYPVCSYYDVIPAYHVHPKL